MWALEIFWYDVRFLTNFTVVKTLLRNPEKRYKVQEKGLTLYRGRLPF